MSMQIGVVSRTDVGRNGVAAFSLSSVADWSLVGQVGKREETTGDRSSLLPPLHPTPSPLHPPLLPPLPWPRLRRT